MSQTPGSDEPFRVPPLSDIDAWLPYLRICVCGHCKWPTREELDAQLDREIEELLGG